jgi:hypothetical protein
VKRNLILASAGLALGSAGTAQNAPKPIPRAEYLKTVDGHFAAADANHDGFLSKPEMVAQLQRDLDTAKSKVNQEITARFNQLDTNHDGKLTLQEFMALTPALRSTETPEQILARLDANHDGKISAEEFRAPELAKFNKVDANHDGIVTPEELKAAGGK